MSQGKSMTEFAQVWSNVLEHLEERVSARNLAKWIEPLRLVHLDNREALLLADDETDALHTRQAYAEQLKDAFLAFGYDVNIDVATSPQLTLPAVGRKHVIMPNHVARSAIFSVRNAGDREYIERQYITSWRGVEMQYTGPTLTQDDLDVWLLLLRLHGAQDVGEPVEFTGSGFLKELDTRPSGDAYERLDARLERLSVSGIRLDDGDVVYQGTLVDAYRRSRSRKTFKVRLNPRLARLFHDEQYARLGWAERQRLGRSLSRWMHAYLHTHDSKQEHFIKVARLRDLCGSHIEKLWRFRAYLRQAMKDLEDASVVSNWHIDDQDCLRVRRRFS